MTKKNIESSLLKSTLLLGVSIGAAKIIGALYRMPLANILGGEGIGIYQMVFPLYAFLLTLSSSAIPTTLAKIISEKLAKGEGQKAREVYTLTKRYIVIISLIFSGLLIMFCKEVATMQGEVRGWLSYIAIAPSLLLVGFVASYRGKFQGMNNMLPTAFSQIFEQIGKLIFSLILPLYFGGTLEEKVALSILGVTISEVCGLLFLLIYSSHHKKYKKNQNTLTAVWYMGKRSGKISKGTLSLLVKIALPMTLSFSIYPLASIFESGIIINALNGMNQNGVEQFGIYSGGMITVLSLPLGVCQALGTALISSISLDEARGERDKSRRKISISIKAIMAISLAISAVFLFFSKEISTLLFSSLSHLQDGLLERLLQFSFLIVIFSTFSNITSSILYGLSKHKVPLYSQIIGSVVRFTMMLILLKYIGIFASLVGLFLGYMISSVINFIEINKHLKKSFSIRPLFKGAFAASLLTVGLYYLSEIPVKNFPYYFTAFMAVIGFFLLLLLMKYFSKEEIFLTFQKNI